MASFNQRPGPDGKPVYRVRVRRKGYPTETATFQRLTDAKKWAQITEAAMAEGRHFKTAESKRRTLADLIDRYIRDVLPHKSRSSIYMQTLQLGWWKEQLGHCILAGITPALIAENRDKLAHGRKNSTVRRYLAALSHAFTVAVREWGWLDDSPMRRVIKPKEPRGRVRFLSDDERQRLLDACQTSHNRYLYTIVVLALSTGARHMEILSLKWHNIDLKRRVIVLNETKNDERRTLPLTGHALELMTQLAKVRRIDTPLVFPRRNGKIPANIRTAWENAVEKAGIEDFCFHDLRHTAASYLAMNGASLVEIATILGHKSLEVTRRYAHLSEHHTANVVARMNNVIFGG